MYNVKLTSASTQGTPSWVKKDILSIMHMYVYMPVGTKFMSGMVDGQIRYTRMAGEIMKIMWIGWIISNQITYRLARGYCVLKELPQFYTTGKVTLWSSQAWSIGRSNTHLGASVWVLVPYTWFLHAYTCTHISSYTSIVRPQQLNSLFLIHRPHRLLLNSSCKTLIHLYKQFPHWSLQNKEWQNTTSYLDV